MVAVGPSCWALPPGCTQPAGRPGLGSNVRSLGTVAGRPWLLPGHLPGPWDSCRGL